MIYFNSSFNICALLLHEIFSLHFFFARQLHRIVLCLAEKARRPGGRNQLLSGSRIAHNLPRLLWKAGWKSGIKNYGAANPDAVFIMKNKGKNKAKAFDLSERKKLWK